ncbi:MAG: HD-GYP domain-containing protein [Deltaproteobacteria bacterium]|nr:HD-GYP domain-containing protein [Deltaproteobacteria bacterium]
MNGERDARAMNAENEALRSENADLRRLLDRTAERLADADAKLRIAHLSTIQTLVRAVEFKDPYRKGHYEMVSKLAVATGRRMGLDDETIDRLRFGGMLMDVGKIAVDTSLLTKQQPLSDVELAAIREHVRVGAQILDPIVHPWEIGELVFQHHERWDGSGYPRGLAGEDILIEARILGICDSFVAMMATRAFRAAFSRTLTLEMIRDESGRKFDPGVVEAFVAVVESGPDALMDEFARHFDMDNDPGI